MLPGIKESWEETKGKYKEQAGLNTGPKNGFHPDGSGEPLRIFEGGIYFWYFGTLLWQRYIDYIGSVKMLIH